MDTSSVFFVVETTNEQEQLVQQYPGRVLLCDRLFVLDTHDKKAITYNGKAITTKLHEVKSVACEIPVREPRVWPLEIAGLPCNCRLCFNDPNNDDCKFAPWTKRRNLNIADNVALPAAENASSSDSECDSDEESVTLQQLVAARSTDNDDSVNDVKTDDEEDACFTGEDDDEPSVCSTDSENDTSDDDDDPTTLAQLA